MLRSLTLSEIVVYNQNKVLMELTKLENIRSLTFRNVRTRCGDCGVLVRWKKCGEVMRELLKSLKQLEEFHFYDEIKYMEDVEKIAEALTQVPRMTKLTLPDVNERSCIHLANIESLKELQIVMYKHRSNLELNMLRSTFEGYREHHAYCSLLIRDIFEVIQ